MIFQLSTVQIFIANVCFLVLIVVFIVFGGDSVFRKGIARLVYFYFIYTIFQEGDTFGMKAILPCGPLNIKHEKQTIYIYTNSKYKQCTLFKFSPLSKIRNN